MVAMLDQAVFVWLLCWIYLYLYGCFVGSDCVSMVALLDLAALIWLLCRN